MTSIPADTRLLCSFRAVLYQRRRRWADVAWTLYRCFVFAEIAFIATILEVIYHPLYSMNKFVTNKSKLPQDRAQVFFYMG